MQNTANTEKPALTVLTAVNISKSCLTIICLLSYVLIFGIHDHRQVIYLCLHLSYCIWWLLEQSLFPARRQLFNEPVNIIGFISILLYVGIFYSLPGFFAFINPNPISDLTIAIALPLYIFGSLINTAADVQKLTAKQYNAGLVKDNIWRFSRNINYFGDLLRYLSFSVVAGSLWAYLLPVAIFLFYLQRISQKEQAMSSKYADFSEYQESSDRLIPFVW
jgi:protein-S-isoprenylcysteine O-methyltransferase Ste14